MSSTIHLNVLDIYLDNDNPRHDPISDQSEIIEYLIEKENVKPLARHISLYGVNPLDSIGVIKSEDGSYIVVEGNRRLCALTLLNDPDKAPKHDVQYFKKLSENSDLIPSFINCVMFDDHSEADVWMVVRHDGEQNGIGTKKWNTEQKARNNAKINRKDDNALGKALIDYVVAKGILPKDRPEKILTTASRYLGNPRFRSTFGIVSGRSEKNVEINAPCHEFDRMLRQFCADLIENTKVNSRSKKPDWEKYARELTESGIAPTSKVQVHSLNECLTAPEPTLQPGNSNYDVPPTGGNDEAKPTDGVNEQGHDEGDATPPQNPKPVPGGTGNTKDPDKRKYIIPHGFKVSINDKTLRRIYKEMNEIEIGEYPLSVALATRAFLENMYDLFHEKVAGHYTEQQTHVVMGKVINLIEQDPNLSMKEKNALGALRRVQSNDKNVLSPKTLGANAHASIYPNAVELKREFDNISEIVVYMLKRI